MKHSKQTSKQRKESKEATESKQGTQSKQASNTKEVNKARNAKLAGYQLKASQLATTIKQVTNAQLAS